MVYGSFFLASAATAAPAAIATIISMLAQFGNWAGATT